MSEWKRQKKKMMISAAFAIICCMVLAALVILAQFKNEAEAEVIEPKSVTAEKVIKNPVTVDQAKEAAKKVTPATPTPTIEVAEAAVTVTVTPEPEKVAEPEEESGDNEEEVEFIATFDDKGTTFEVEDATISAEESTFVEEAVVEEPEPVYEEEPIYYDAETQEEMPTPADEFAYQDQTFLGAYTVTFYSREAVGYDAPGASGNGLTPWYSVAMPEYWMLNHTVYIEGFGYFHVDDISPGSIADIYVSTNAEIPSYGMTTANVYIVG